MLNTTFDMGINALARAYQSNACTPQDVMNFIRQTAARYSQHNIWLHLLSEEEQAPWLANLATKDPAQHPLWGIPFAIKDNIDLAGIATTAGCDAFSAIATQSARVVQKLIDAGAIPVGKTALDQFATGLNGTRSSIGPCRNAFNPDYISGGSSSGSAVALALGLCSFSLGTDTAGSGRVPAAFNNIIGLKPSRGLLSTRGVVPACRSLDCVSIFAFDTDDANRVLSVAEGFDAQDPYSRDNPFINRSRHYGKRTSSLTIGIIPSAQLEFFGDAHYAQAYIDTLATLKDTEIRFHEIDFSPFVQAAKLLYEGPWVAERYIATQPLIVENPDALLPVVRNIIAAGKNWTATDVFKAQYQLEGLRRDCQAQLAGLDCLLTPTAGSLFSLQALLDNPIALNTALGYYTNFMNLVDLAAIAVPTQITPQGLPFGVTLIGKAFTDRALLSIANRFQSIFQLNKGALPYPIGPLTQTPATKTGQIDIVVCGAHLQGLPLNWQLSERGARLKKHTHTAPEYRLYALAGGPPFRPGLVLDKRRGAAIAVEVWEMPVIELGDFVANIPAPLGMGKVTLADGSQACGFICEAYAVDNARDITDFGGWRAFLEDGA